MILFSRKITVFDNLSISFFSLADQKKEEGNQLYLSKNYREALQRYNEAISKSNLWFIYFAILHIFLSENHHTQKDGYRIEGLLLTSYITWKMNHYNSLVALSQIPYLVKLRSKMNLDCCWEEDVVVFVSFNVSLFKKQRFMLNEDCINVV